LDGNQLIGSISFFSSLTSLTYLALNNNQLSGSIPSGTDTRLVHLQFLDLSHNYLTGPLVKLRGFEVDVSNNYLSGVLSGPVCNEYNLGANCFTVYNSCSKWAQRPAAQCAAFCGINSTTAACGGLATCYPDGPSLVPTCECQPGFAQFGGFNCGAEGWVKSLQISGPIRPPFTILTKGTLQETAKSFMEKPVTLFAYPSGVSSGCGVELAFSVNFTFLLMPQSGTAGSNGFAFVIAERAKVGNPDGVGYGGMGTRSIAVEFDTLYNDAHGDMSKQHVGLNINGTDKSLITVESPFTLSDGNAYTAWVDYEPGDPGNIEVYLADSKTKPRGPLLRTDLSLCAVLGAGVKQRAFFFGFVASTTVKPFQLHGIAYSAMQTGISSLKKVHIRYQARGFNLSVATFAPPRGSPFLRYVSSNYIMTDSEEDSWGLGDLHSWNALDFLGWPVKDQIDCNA
ncbi:hypothetical protein CLOM_g14179, partial [Closterium sp. NIES-68]